jgi:hypothetical protein
VDDWHSCSSSKHSLLKLVCLTNQHMSHDSGLSLCNDRSWLINNAGHSLHAQRIGLCWLWLPMACRLSCAAGQCWPVPVLGTAGQCWPVLANASAGQCWPRRTTANRARWHESACVERTSAMLPRRPSSCLSSSAMSAIGKSSAAGGGAVGGGGGAAVA